MSTKTDYSNEIKRLIDNLYSPVATKEEATGTTAKKTLTDIHMEVVRILPSRWIYEDDVYQALQEMKFNYFRDVDDDGKPGLFYYMNPR